MMRLKNNFTNRVYHFGLNFGILEISNGQKRQLFKKESDFQVRNEEIQCPGGQNLRKAT